LANASYVYVFVAGSNHVDGPAADVAALDLAAIFLGHDEPGSPAGSGPDQTSQSSQNGAKEN
jgi:hypothetical protein